jgi:hypothetical protein
MSEIFIKGVNIYGYRYDITNFDIREHEENFRVRHGIYYMDALTHEQRLQFERELDALYFPDGISADEKSRRELYAKIQPALMEAASKKNSLLGYF